MSKSVTILADAVIELAAEEFVEWIMFQARMLEIARRGTWVHDGGIQGVVVYHDADAIR